MTAPAGRPQIQCCGVWTDYPSPDMTTQCPVCGTVFTVKTTLTRKRPPKVVENDEYTAFLQRAIRALGRRVSGGDIDAVIQMTLLSGELDNAIHLAVTGLRAKGYSWAEIGNRLGVSRQAAQQRFGGDTP